MLTLSKSLNKSFYNFNIIVADKQKRQNNDDCVVSLIEEDIISEEIKQQKKHFMNLVILLSVSFIIVFSSLVYIGFSLRQSTNLMQEQINYLYERDNLIEANFKKFISFYQQQSKDKSAEEGFAAYLENKSKPAERQNLAPFDHISQEQIMVYGDRIIIKNENFEWAQYEDTKSMVPILSSTANGIEIKPESPEDIHVGDIISYYYKDSVIVHRVIRIGIDDNGWYAVTKADNSDKEDPIKIRYDKVNGILVGIIY